jgi:hypothetical protein
MVKTRGIARLGMLAVGLGVGAAWAHTPVASADSSSGWLSSIDSLLSGALPAPAATSDFQISFNGTDLFPTAGNEATATTVAGQFGLAIAFGDGAHATAEGGTGDYALADGTNALANAGSLTSGATGNNFDVAEDIGNNTVGGSGAPDGAYAGAGSLIGAPNSTGTDSNDTAIDFGNNGPDGTEGGNTGAFAGDGELVGLSGAGNSDTAIDSGNNLGFGDGPAAVDGNSNYASESGNTTGMNEGAFAAIGDHNTAVADNNYTTDFAGVFAGAGNDNSAFADGPANSGADAGGTTTALGDASTELGNGNIAYVVDPFGSTADSAIAGSTTAASGSNDLAEVLLTHGNAVADGGNFLYDIITLFGNIVSP